MSRRNTVIVALVVGAIAFAAGRVYSGDDKDKAPPQPSPEEMAKYAEYVKPIAQHKLLTDRAGNWDVDASMFEVPGAEPKKSKGSATCKVGPGGLWVIEDHKGEMMGMPFEGHGVFGYSKEKEKYVGFWVDSMGTIHELMW